MGYSDATKELCDRLDELGVRNWEGDDERKTLWESNGLTWEYFNDDNGEAWLGFLGACEHDVTPEQAIAATVGEEHEMHICKRCGVAHELNIIDKGFGKSRFCPNCGHRRLYQ